jgi:hypothetical protein
VKCEDIRVLVPRFAHAFAAEMSSTHPLNPTSKLVALVEKNSLDRYTRRTLPARRCPPRARHNAGVMSPPSLLACGIESKLRDFTLEHGAA